MASDGNKTIIKEKFIGLIHDVKFYKMEKQLGGRGRYFEAHYLWQAGKHCTGAGTKFCIIF